MTSPTPRIYPSLLPPVPGVNRSIFTYLFEQVYNPEDASSAAYIDFASGYTLTRGDVKHLSLRLARALRTGILLPSLQPPAESQKYTALGCGDTVMIFSPNSISWPIVLFSCIAAGLRISFPACTLTARELSWQYTDSCPRAVFTSEALVPTVMAMFKLLGVSDDEAARRVFVMDLDFDKLQCNGRQKGIDNGQPRRLDELMTEQEMQCGELFEGTAANETVFLCYSSGTTGRPKGVEISHKNICTGFGMMQAMFRGCETPDDVYIAVLPFYHIYGLSVVMQYCFMRARPLVIMPHGFDTQSFCHAIEKYKVTTLYVVPPILLILGTDPVVDRYDITSVRSVVSGAAHLSKAVATKFLTRFNAKGANVVLVEGFGSTETSCPSTLVLPKDSIRKFGSVGQLVPNLEVRLVVEVSSSDGTAVLRDAAEGEEGEMWVRGPSIVKGYLNNNEANASSFIEDGWYKTGDVLKRDTDGYFYIVDRKKEMIKYKAYQVAPAELEAILMENAEIADVGVIGVPDEYTGDELPRAYIVPSDRRLLCNEVAASVSEFEKRVEGWFREQVSHVKYLRGGVRVVTQIPKSGTGKILRKDLREMAIREGGKKGDLSRL